MTDEVMIRMGLDTRAVASGLRSAKHAVNEWTGEVKNTFHEFGRNLLAAVAGAGIEHGLEKEFEAVKRIKAAADSLGVSTGFIQDLTNVGNAAGIGAEAMEKLLGKFEKSLTEGSDVEVEFFRIVDQLAKIEDPATRAHLALDKFGKSGIEMLKIVEGGSAGIKEMASQFSKLSDAQLDRIEEIHREFERLGNTATTWGGKFIAALASGARVWGALSTNIKDFFNAGKLSVSMGADEQNEADSKALARRDAQRSAAQAKAAKDASDALGQYEKHLGDVTLKSGTTSEKLAILNGRLKEQDELAQNEQDVYKKYDALAKVATIEQDIADVKEKDRKAQEEASEKRRKASERELEQQEQILHADESLMEAQKSLADSRHDRSALTIQDLANGPGPARRTALTIEQLEANAKRARQFGFFDRADSLTDRALDLRKSISGFLTTGEGDPLRSMARAIGKSEEHLAEILRKAANEGLNINPTNG